MTDLTTIKSLQTRIREATGADREIEHELCLAFGGEFSGNMDQRFWRHPNKTSWEALPPPYMRSLDACVALMRETLPGAKYERHRNGPIRIWDAQDHLINKDWTFNLASDCLTFLDSICSALIARESVS